MSVSIQLRAVSSKHCWCHFGDLLSWPGPDKPKEKENRMKFLILSSLLISASVFAQSLTLDDFKTLAQTHKASWTANHVGQTKVVSTTGVADNCTYTKTSTQSVLKFENGKLIILADDKFAPAASNECQTAGFTSYEEKILFYQDLPNPDADLAYLFDASTKVQSIEQTQNIVSMNLTMNEVPFMVKYDVSLSGLENLILIDGDGVKTAVASMADVDVTKFDLSNVLFCENNDGDNSECTQGNYSDILF